MEEAAEVVSNMKKIVTDIINDKYLKKFPGIGAKASQQIILDLAGKLSFTEEIKTSGDSSIKNKLDDVTDALVALGYSKKEALKVVEKLDPTLDEGMLVKEALKKLVR